MGYARALNLFQMTELSGDPYRPNQYLLSTRRLVTCAQRSTVINWFHLTHNCKIRAYQDYWIHLSDIRCPYFPGCNYHHPLGLTSSQKGSDEGHPVLLFMYHTTRQDWASHSSTKPLGIPSRYWYLTLGIVHHIFHQSLNDWKHR